MSKRKLLLADDSETVQKVVNLTFDLEGIEVITFGDGDSAMAQFATVAPDVVLADVNMPGMSGYEICRNIKSNAATKHIPVILLVGSFEPFDEEKAMQVGADDYLTKPFQSIRQLVTKVNELLSPSENKDFDEFEFNKTLEMEKKPFSDSDFGNPGMDDEMIQTSQMADPEPAASPATSYQSSNDSYSDSFDDSYGDSYSAPQTDDVSVIQPLSAADWQSSEYSSETAEYSAQTVYELAEDQDDQPVAVQDTEEFAPTYEEPQAESEENFAGNVETDTEEAAQTNFEENTEVNTEENSEINEAERTDESAAEYAEPDSSGEANFEQFESFDANVQSADSNEENEFGIQPDDIDHFYEEPDYKEEDSVEIPVFSAENQESVSAAQQVQQYEPEQNREQNQEQEQYQPPQQNDESETGFEIVENDSPAIEENLSAAEEVPANEEAEIAETNAAETSAFAEQNRAASSPQSFSSAHDLDFDDFDLLEDSFSVKPETRSAEPFIKTQEPEPRVETVEEKIEDGNSGEQIKNQVSEQLSGVNLSQADIDAIAEKVVEKLTARMKE